MRRIVTIALLLAAGLVTPALAAPPKILWSTALNQPVYSAPQAADGWVYLTSMQPTGPNVFAIDGGAGKVSWSFATQGAIAIPPTVGKTQLFVASDIDNTHFLRAIDAKTGALIWQYTRDQPPECMCSQASIVSGNLLFAQSDGHSLYAFAPNGAAPSKRIWQFPGDGAPLSGPVVADGLVVFGSGDHNVYALDAATGAVRWTGTTGYVFTADPLVTNGVVVIGDQGGNIDGFDLKTGKSLWSFAAAAAVDDAAIAFGDNAYVVSEDHSVYAFNSRSGQPAWQYAMDDYAQFGPILAGKDLVVANRAGELLAFNAKTGKIAWQTELDGVPFSATAYWPAQNAVVIKLGDHEIAAFDASTGKARWRYRSDDVVTNPVVDGNTVVVATSSGNVIALD